MNPEFYGSVEQRDVLSETRIIFPQAAAPHVNVAMERLFEAFPDHEPTLSSESEDHWVFHLNWASDPRTFVDPRVPAMAKSLYGLSGSEIGCYRELHSWGKRDVVFSMVHSWALLAPARALARCCNHTLSWVVHLDDHTDLMAPFLEPLPQLGVLRDRIFEEDVILGDPSSVVSAISRGTISKGNFLTAFLLAYPGCRAVHVGDNLAEQYFRPSRQTEVAELGGKRFERHGFSLDPIKAHEHWAFRQTSSLPIDLPVGKQEGVWLDIDLDYFWNRYNGDSNKRSEIALSGERAEIMRRVNRSLAKLKDAAWLTNLEAVSVAVSPGFFPSEYWAEVIKAVCDGVHEALEA
jgi:hypothetical protein